jgi:hypothetical protein
MALASGDGVLDAVVDADAEHRGHRMGGVADRDELWAVPTL